MACCGCLQDGLAPDSIHALSGLTRLQTLLLGPRPSPGVAESLPSLSQSLGRLEIWCNLCTSMAVPDPVGLAFEGTTTEQTFLASLTGLTSLVLADFCSLDASLLPSLTALQSLQLHLASKGCTLGTATLLPALAQCTRLTSLRLGRVYSGAQHRWAAAPARPAAAAPIPGYAALTSSPVLELLGCVIPQGAWAYIFGGDDGQRQLPRLVHVHISNITGGFCAGLGKVRFHDTLSPLSAGLRCPFTRVANAFVEVADQTEMAAASARLCVQPVVAVHELDSWALLHRTRRCHARRRAAADGVLLPRAHQPAPAPRAAIQHNPGSTAAADRTEGTLCGCLYNALAQSGGLR